MGTIPSVVTTRNTAHTPQNFFQGGVVNGGGGRDPGLPLRPLPSPACIQGGKNPIQLRLPGSGRVLRRGPVPPRVRTPHHLQASGLPSSACIQAPAYIPVTAIP